MIIVRAPRTTSGRIASVMRLRSSGGACCSHSGFGTTPNIAPPSSRKKPSDSEIELEIAERETRAIARHRRRTRGRGDVPRACFSSTSTPCVARGVDERDQRAFGAGPRLLVDEPRAARLQLRERGMDVVDAQRDVMEPGAALADVLRDRRVGRRRLEQLELRFPDGHEVRADALRRHFFRRLDLEAERVAIERQRGRQVLHRDPDVIQDGLHGLGNRVIG